MLGAARLPLVAALLAGWLLAPAPVWAIVPQVNDQGKFFDADAIKKADAEIKKIERDHKKDVAVETFDHIPESILKKYNFDPDKRKASYLAWMQEQSEGESINGVMILIVKDKDHEIKAWIEIGVGRETAKKAFCVWSVWITAKIEWSG